MITIIDQPYSWALRGQKLMIIASSDAVANTGFKYGITVGTTTLGGPFTFFISPSIDTNLYFDLQPLFDAMRNLEPMNYHFATDNTALDGSEVGCSFTIQEWWLVDGILTANPESEVGNSLVVVNGYFQVIDGYKPNVQTGSQKVKQSLTNTSSYMMSDRNNTTSPFYLSESWGFGVATNSIWIPVLESDYGVMCIPGNSNWLTNNAATQFRITIFSSSGIPTQQTIALDTHNIEALPIYPANLNDWTGLTVKPSLFPNWRCYTVAILNASNGQCSETYVFYNAHDYGQSDCNWKNMRLGWVNSRGGWDYFNFTKKSEITNEIDRKQYRKVLFNGTTGVFSANDRTLTQRQNLVQQVLTVTSDYITEGEFIFLRSLLASNQVTWITEDAGKAVEVPVNIDDTSYVEKRTTDGKLYNVTLRVRLSNQYWT